MDQKNFIIALVLSVLIIVGWQQAFPTAKAPVATTQQPASTQPGAPGARRGRADVGDCGVTVQRGGVELLWRSPGQWP